MTITTMALQAQGQLLTDNGATITVQNGAQVSIKGAVLAQAAAWIDNAGVIDLSGDITNNSVGTLFTATPGTVIMNGTAQTIGGSAATDFNNLDLLCNTLALQQDIQAGGTLALANGVTQLGAAIVQLNSHRITVLNTSPNAITRTTGRIVSETDPLAGYGELAWRIDNGTGNYVVPFGTIGSYLPLTLNITASAPGTWGFVFATYPTDPFATPNNRPLPTGLSSLVDVGGNENAPNVVDRYWPITTTGAPSPPTATLTFTYQDAEWNTGTNTIMEAALQAQRFNGTAWSQPPNGTVNTTLNTVSTTPTSAFDLVWALTMSNTSLPVELLAFNAKPEGDRVLCEWATATETNNAYFTVERSADGLAFIDIGEVPGAGSSQSSHTYTFVDADPLEGLSYYRLRQTDFDGQESWSVIVPVRLDAPASGPILYPNPCEGTLFVHQGIAGERFQVIDATGRIVDQQRLGADGSLDVSSLAPGSYTLRAHDNSRRSARFVRQ